MAIRIERPESVREALELKRKGDAAYLGGGTWLGSLRGGGPVTLISLERLGLDGIRGDGDAWRIGAGVTLQAIVDDARLPPALRSAASLTASRTLRTMATLGGETALRSVDSAILPVLRVLGARVVIAGRRSGVDADAWCASASPDLIVEVLIDRAARLCGVRAVSRGSHGARSLVAAVGARAVAPIVKSAVVFVSDCVGTAVRLAAVEKSLEGKSLPPRDRIEAMVRDAWRPASDMHASALYKGHIAAVCVADLLHEIGGPA